jgi:hypothetical protein
MPRCEPRIIGDLLSSITIPLIIRHILLMLELNNHSAVNVPLNGGHRCYFQIYIRSLLRQPLKVMVD